MSGSRVFAPHNDRSSACKAMTLRNVTPARESPPMRAPAFMADNPSTNLALRRVALNISLNDDAVEKRARQVDGQQNDFMSPGVHTPRNVTANVERRKACFSGRQFTNAQVTSHYKQCIKLSSENKINAKNAFGLHLIDYMADMLDDHGMTNFQVAGCALDASAKIYAGRVDSIYTDALKVLGGLNKGSEDRCSDTDSQENETAVISNKGSSKKHPKNHSNAFQSVEKNIKNLDAATVDTNFQVDPLYQKTASSFDEGGIEGLLLNNLFVLSDSCELVVDPCTSLKALHTLPPPCLYPRKELEGLFPDVLEESTRICPTFDTFIFNPSKPTNSKIHEVDITWQQVNDGNTDGNDCQENCSFEDDKTECFSNENYPTEDLEGSLIASIRKLGDPLTRIHPEHPQTFGFGLSDILQLSECGYLKLAELTSWEGPQHWKIKPVQKASRKKTTEGRVPFRVNFEGLVSPASFKIDKKCCKLSKAAVKKMQQACVTLPHKEPISAKVLFVSFSSEDLMVNKQSVSDPFQEDLADGTTSYISPNDNQDLCPINEIFSDDDGCTGAFANDLVSSPTHNNNSNFPHHPLDLNESNLLRARGLPQQIHLPIEFSKTSFKVDVKKIKQRLFDVIESCNQEKTSCSFGKVCEEMYSADMARYTSVPVLFVCLLHLANDKVLALNNLQEGDDFGIQRD